ncbi:MAG: ComEC/Rec2 family competence protein [Sphingomonadaceae bacterium]
MIGRMEQWLDSERDQLALWLPVALGCGIAGWFLIATREGWIAFMMTAAAVAVAAALLPAGRLRRAIVVFALLVATGCALIWWRAESIADSRLERPRIVQFSARIEKVELLTARDLVRLTLIPDADQSLPHRLRVNVDEAKVSDDLAPGMGIRLRARLMPPASAALPGAYDFARVAWFRGLGGTGGALGAIEVLHHDPARGAAAWINHVRARLTAHVQSAVGGSAGGIAAALVTGNQGGIAEDDVEALRASGLAHLLSISGLHVTAVVAGTMLIMLRLLALSPTLALRLPLSLVAAAFAAIAGITYTLIAGAEIPTVRSCIAAILVLIALAMGREAITLRLIATGALIVSLLWPEGLISPSFQLSFAAVTALVAFNEQPAIRNFGRRREGAGWIDRTARNLLLLLATGLVIEVVLSPIALYHFHRAGVYGAVANMIAIPLTTLVIMPAIFLGLLLDLAGLGMPSWWIAEISLNLLKNISHFVEDQPGSVTTLPTMPVGAFAMMTLAGIWFFLWKSRARHLSLPLFGVGAIWAAAAPVPDLLITGDGRHAAVRGSDGSLFLLRTRAGDYVRETIGTVAAEPDLRILDDMADARCNADLCVVDARRDERNWRVFATRSPYLVPWKDLIRACAQSDIAISDRRLPKACAPRWLKADRTLLEQTGGMAIRFDPFFLQTVRAPRDDHPWMRINRASYRK